MKIAIYFWRLFVFSKFLYSVVRINMKGSMLVFYEHTFYNCKTFVSLAQSAMIGVDFWLFCILYLVYNNNGSVCYGKNFSS